MTKEIIYRSPREICGRPSARTHNHLDLHSDALTTAFRTPAITAAKSTFSPAVCVQHVAYPRPFYSLFYFMNGKFAKIEISLLQKLLDPYTLGKSSNRSPVKPSILAEIFIFQEKMYLDKKRVPTL